MKQALEQALQQALETLLANHPDAEAPSVVLNRPKLLHDVVEDSSLSFEQLQQKGIPKEVIEILRHLTESRKESYDEFIERVMKNKVAVKVKIEDIKDNMDMNRLPNVTEVDLNRLQKYHRALKRLVFSAFLCALCGENLLIF